MKTRANWPKFQVSLLFAYFIIMILTARYILSDRVVSGIIKVYLIEYLISFHLFM